MINEDKNKVRRNPDKPLPKNTGSIIIYIVCSFNLVYFKVRSSKNIFVVIMISLFADT